MERLTLGFMLILGVGTTGCIANMGELNVGDECETSDSQHCVGNTMIRVCGGDGQVEEITCTEYLDRRGGCDGGGESACHEHPDGDDVSDECRCADAL